MKKLFNKYTSVFFVGIGGISMSALAKLVFNMGIKVAGSDRSKSNITKNLCKMGIKVYFSHKKSNVKDCDLVVFSGAIGQENEELQFAKKNKIDIMERSTFLGKISKHYKNVVAIAGTHGKTTTTAMIGYAFIIAGYNPTVHLGGESKLLGGNLYLGGKNFFITEACEFRDSFLSLSPKVSVVTNLESEHLDYFKSFENEIFSFNQFAKKSKWVCFINSQNERLFRDDLDVKCYDKQFCVKNIRKWQCGKYQFDLYDNKNFVDNFKLNICGRYNINNALATICVCRQFGISWQTIKLALLTFENVDRRFEYLGNYKDNLVICDYAHHPTEIKNSIQCCLDNYKMQPICIFQPHTFSRTKMFLNDFVDCFKNMSKVFVVQTYSAREKYDFLGSAEHLCQKIKAEGNLDIIKVCPKENIIKEIEKNNFSNEILLFLGAGDIVDEAKKIVKIKA